jgi:hypothetical protein
MLEAFAGPHTYMANVNVCRRIVFDEEEDGLNNNIAISNGYDTSVVDKIIIKIKSKTVAGKLYPSDITREPKVF